MNIIAWLEFELAYCGSAVHRLNHYTTRTPTIDIGNCLKNIMIKLERIQKPKQNKKETYHFVVYVHD